MEDLSGLLSVDLPIIGAASPNMETVLGAGDEIFLKAVRLLRNARAVKAVVLDRIKSPFFPAGKTAVERKRGQVINLSPVSKTCK